MDYRLGSGILLRSTFSIRGVVRGNDGKKESYPDTSYPTCLGIHNVSKKA
ncbi:hypothetical protein RI844_07295 [Thalassotalea fonticola]|uniref:Uncharacterized protein n=1 Tax=Thalassotalea fonticola TaxID=3065649 RepID=A0ABZ0GTJ3_9GAMM|nr:hypothetical protein RI844_07295 [Colwelliaceae bacterium S1-1]